MLAAGGAAALARERRTVGIGVARRVVVAACFAAALLVWFELVLRPLGPAEGTPAFGRATAHAQQVAEVEPAPPQQLEVGEVPQMTEVDTLPGGVPPTMALKTIAEELGRRRGMSDGAHSATRDFTHQCGKFYKSCWRRGFALMAMHGPVLSIEQKVAMTFATALQELQQRRRGANVSTARGGAAGARSAPPPPPRQGHSRTRLIGGRRCSDSELRSAAVVVDVGVNDAEDIPTWFDLFGTWHDSCTTYFLFEPQQQYWPMIADEVRRHYFLQPGYPRVPLRKASPDQQRRTSLADVLRRSSSSAADLDSKHEVDREGADGEKSIDVLRRRRLLVSIDAVMQHLADETPDIFGPRGVALPAQRDRDAAVVAQRRVVLLRTAVGPEQQHNGSVLLRGEGQSASIVKIDAIRADDDAGGGGGGGGGRGGGTSAIRVLSMLRVLNDFTTHTAQHINFLKIDCEGADATILVASEPLFAQQRVDFVMFELNKVVRNFPRSYVDAVRMLRRHRYRCFVVGYDRDARSLMLSEVDEHVFVFWRPKLETMICLPAALIGAELSPASSGGAEEDGGGQGSGKSEDTGVPALFPSGLVPGARELTQSEKYSFFLRVTAASDRYTPTVRHWTDMCFGSVFAVPCEVCGGEKFR